MGIGIVYAYCKHQDLCHWKYGVKSIEETKPVPVLAF